MTQGPAAPESHNRDLARVLKVRHVVAIALGFTLADGILLVMADLFHRVGPVIIVMMVAGAACMVFVLLAGAELAGSIPAADYAGRWGRRTIGSYWGHLGSMSYAAFSVIIVGVLWFPMGTYLKPIFPGLSVPVLGTLSFLITALIVYFGAEATGRAEVWLNVVLIVVAAVLVVAALANFDAGNFTPFVRTDFAGIMAAFPFVIYVYSGPTLLFAASEENVESPNFWPKAVFTLMTIIIVAYMLLMIATLGLLPIEAYSLDEATIATAAQHLFGDAGLAIFSIVAYLAVFTCMSSAIYTGSRFLFSMSRQGLLPRSLSKVSARRKTPDNALYVTLVIGVLVGSTYYLEEDAYLTAVSIFTMAGLIGWIVICTSHISYRLRPSLRRAYPGTWHVWPKDHPSGIWVSVLGLVAAVAVGVTFVAVGDVPLWLLAAWLVLSVVWWGATRKRVDAIENGARASKVGVAP